MNSTISADLLELLRHEVAPIELAIGKLIRRVLRGLGGSNPARLPDPGLLLRGFALRKVDCKEDPREVGYEIAEKANARL
jgi:hypothetical protein